MFLYLLPPSEGKQAGGQAVAPQRYFDVSLPRDIARQATEKDLKCSGTRYTEGIQLNKNIEQSPLLPAIQRYSGVMYKSLDYDALDTQSKKRANDRLLIFSGMYGLLQPQDMIGNYKLPITTKGLYAYRKQQDLTQQLISHAREKQAILIDLLPLSYKKMIDRKQVHQQSIPYIQVNFYQKQENERKKYTHGVKKVKGERLRHHLSQKSTTLEQLGGVRTEDELQIII